MKCIKNMKLLEYCYLILYLFPLQALVEEKAVYDRSINRLKYMSVAVNALKKLKSNSSLPSKG